MADLNRIREDEPDPKVEVIKDIIPEQTRYEYGNSAQSTSGWDI